VYSQCDCQPVVSCGSCCSYAWRTRMSRDQQRELGTHVGIHLEDEEYRQLIINCIRLEIKDLNANYGQDQ
jgi:hypothetical protein